MSETSGDFNVDFFCLVDDVLACFDYIPCSSSESGLS